jgi:hypothetical protein
MLYFTEDYFNIYLLSVFLVFQVISFPTNFEEHIGNHSVFS